jgi:uncharacterized protein YjbI with pentapeptide repeats
MADPDHLKTLQQGVDAWNAWREWNSSITPDLREANLRGANLSGADLSNANLYGAELSRADLSHADLHGANLSGADLTAANLGRARLSEATLRRAENSVYVDFPPGVNLTEANLGGANLSGADLSGANLSGADLGGANLSGANLSANLSGADLTAANLSRADLGGAYLHEANLSWADLTAANLSRANLGNAGLWEANLSGADLTEASLPDAYLTAANLAAANLSRADLSGADLSGADLTEANLAAAKLAEADLSGANLRRAYLSVDIEFLPGVDLTGANLSWADLTEANLSRADVSGANLYEANLNGTDLTAANLSRTDLSGANLGSADLSAAHLHEATLSWADLTAAKFGGADLSRANLQKANCCNVDFRQASLIDSRLDAAVITGSNLWETQRAGWSIRAVVCEKVFWDRDGKEPTHYAGGDFERVFADKPRIVLRYPAGLLPIDLVMLPLVIERLQTSHPDCSLHIRSVQDDGIGVAVVITVDDTSNRDRRTRENEVSQLQAKIKYLEGRIDTYRHELMPLFRDTVLRGQTIIGHLGASTMIEGSMSRDVYKIEGQVGAIGPKAHAHDLTFQQLRNESGLDLPQLAQQLARLRTAMKEETEDIPDHDAAIGAVAAAENAAAQGDGPAALRLLKVAGRWSLGIAEKIGVTLAAEAIKSAI